MTEQQDLAESVDALERAIATLKSEDYDHSQAMMLLWKMFASTPGMRPVLAVFLEQSSQNREPGAPEVLHMNSSPVASSRCFKVSLPNFRSSLVSVRQGCSACNGIVCINQAMRLEPRHVTGLQVGVQSWCMI